MTALHRLGLHELSRRLAAREVSARELTDALIDRCEEMAASHALVTPLFEHARAAALRCDTARAAGASCGPLHGIPVVVKDAIAVGGVATRLCGPDFVPRSSAKAWRALDTAGMVLLGKAHCAEYCLGAPGAADRLPFALNPHDPARTPGASSSGSAAALAMGMIPAALGTDTGGSIRIPAGFCGVVGLKPTGGLVSRQGVFPLSPSLDQVGPMARDSRDCALLLDALLGRSDPASSHAAGLTDRLDGLRIGHVARFGTQAGAAPAQRAAIASALAIMEDLGARVEVVSLPDLQDFTDVFLPLMLSEAYGLHADAVARDAGMSEHTRIRLRGGAGIEPAEAHRARVRRDALVRAVDPVWEQVDALIFEIAPDDPPLIAGIHPLDYLRAPMLAVPANLLDTPALCVRCGTSPAGLPIGMQILGRRHADSTVLRIGHAYEQATGAPNAPVEAPAWC